MTIEFEDLKFLASVRQYVSKKPSMLKLVFEAVLEASMDAVTDAQEVSKNWESIAIASMQLVKADRLTDRNKHLANQLIEMRIADLRGKGTLNWPEHSLLDQRDEAVRNLNILRQRVDSMYPDSEDAVKQAVR